VVAALALVAPGVAVASEVWADFNGDGFADLAVGVEVEDIGSIQDAGAVNVLYGTDAGLSSTGNQFWHQDSPGVLDVAESYDLFGSALAAADFDGDCFADLAVGVRQEGIGTLELAGAVNVLYGEPLGLSAYLDQFWHQDSPGILDVAEAYKYFGETLAAGDFDGDGFADLAIGAPGEDLNITFPVKYTIENAGAVNVLYGSNGPGVGLSSDATSSGTRTAPGSSTPPRPSTSSAERSRPGISTATPSPTSRSGFRGRISAP
jgi:hypothetical protein